MLAAFAAQLAVAVREQELTREADEAAGLQEVNELRTAILAAVSHDLRTPLASIKASVSSLRQDDVAWNEQETGEFLATIEEETDRLSTLVANLLDMSRLQTGALNLVLSRVGLDEVVPRALESLSDRGRSVEIDVPGILAAGRRRRGAPGARGREPGLERADLEPRRTPGVRAGLGIGGPRRAPGGRSRPGDPRSRIAIGCSSRSSVWATARRATGWASASPWRADSSRRWEASSWSMTHPAVGSRW